MAYEQPGAGAYTSETEVNLTVTPSGRAREGAAHHEHDTQAARNAALADSLLQRLNKKATFQTRLLTEAMAQQSRISEIPEQQESLHAFKHYHLSHLRALKVPIQSDMEITKPMQALQTRALSRAGCDPQRFHASQQEASADIDVAIHLHEAPKLGGLQPYPFHVPQKDAKVLRRSLRGWTTGDKSLIHTLVSRDLRQRLAVAHAYNAAYKRDLAKDIASNTSGSYRTALLSLLQPADVLDAHLTRKAIEGFGTKDSALIEVLCSRTNTQITRMKAAYLREFGRDAESDIRGDTSGQYQQLLLTICKGTRSDSVEVDNALAAEDALRLFHAGETRAGTNEADFIEVLTQRSFTQLRATCAHYEKLNEYDLEASIEREMSGGLKKGLVTIVRAAKSCPAYFAGQLRKAMEGFGTSEGSLVRILVSRAEVDLLDIEAAYFDLCGTSLQQELRKELQGSAKLLKVLLELFGDGTFDPDIDAKRLKKALARKLGTDERALNAVTAARTSQQRLLIRFSFEQNYRVSLLKELAASTHGNYRRFLQGAYVTPAEFAAFGLNAAMEGAGATEQTLIEILGSATPAELVQIKVAYGRLFTRDLVSVVEQETSGDHSKFLQALLTHARPFDDFVEEDEARERAARLCRALDSQWTDEDELIEILGTSGPAMMRRVDEIYSQISSFGLERSLAKRTSGSLRRALVAFVQMGVDSPLYFANRLQHAMKGLGTTDRTLIRIALMRSEKDLTEIARMFALEHQRTLEAAVCKEASGSYKRILLKFIERAEIRPYAEAQQRSLVKRREERNLLAEYPELTAGAPA